jgi:hypothetical protein
MNLIHEFTMSATLGELLPIGAGPIGTRMHYDLTGGQISGDRLNGKVLGGGEWALLREDGFIGVDVRAQVKTDDGAHLYIQYTGLLEMNEAVQAALGSGEGSSFEDQYFYTNPRIETGDERYAWLNTTFFIGEGRITQGGGVEYRVWRPA